MKLLEFPHSHYCEKARWALNYKGVPFKPVAIMPGFHMITVRQYAPDTSVPVLLNGADAIQGSSEIIDYLEQAYPAIPLTPTNASERQKCLEIERTMDKKIGVPIRQILYYSLLAHPEFIQYCFTHTMPKLKQFIFRLIYPALRSKIYKTYVISEARVNKAKREFDATMSELQQLLENREYLVGEQFSRADLSVASLLSLLVMPAEHPFPWIDIPDNQTSDFINQYSDHPVTHWVTRMYRDHRLSGNKILESM